MMKSFLLLKILLEGVDSTAPSLSSLCETLHAQWQLYQMFSHKAQMGRADKHQLSAESRSEAILQNPHSNRLPSLTRRNSSFLCTGPQSPVAVCAAILMSDRTEGFTQLRVSLK